LEVRTMTRTLAACAAILTATLVTTTVPAGAADQTVGVRTSSSAKVKVSKAPRAYRYGRPYSGPDVEPCCEPYYAYGYLPYNFFPYRYAYYPYPYFRRPPNGVGPFGWSAPTGYGW
jgi:hypothetical protein